MLLIEGAERRKYNSTDELLTLLYFLHWYQFVASKIAVGKYEKLPENSDCTCPDFKVSIGKRIIGIEITQIPELSRESTKKFITEQKFERKVIQILTDADLSGTIHFNLRYQQNPDFSSGKLDEYASQLCKLFLDNIKRGNDFINFHSAIPEPMLGIVQEHEPLNFLPESLQFVLSYAFVEYREERMYNAPVIYFPHPDPSLIVSREEREDELVKMVRQKNNKDYNQCKYVDEVWLVMRNREEWTFTDYALPRPDLSSYETFKRVYAVTGYEGIAKRNGKDNPKPNIRRLK